MTKVSVCIPTYEVNGKGVEYLNHSLTLLQKQTYQDFEVIVSDHSINDDIKKLCDDWKSRLDIQYVANDYGRGSISCNTNVAIKHAKGEVIKILFQDDFLYDEQSLEIQLVHLLGNHNQWLVTACCHYNDKSGLHNPFYPKYNDGIHYGQNTISCPSVLMFRNTDVEFFNEDLNWLMDVEYYKRMYDKFGLPAICNYITVVNREHANQVTATLATDTLKRKEYDYMVAKYAEDKIKLDSVTLVSVAGVDAVGALKALKYSCREIDFAKVILITPEDIQDDSVEIIKCNPLNYEQYNEFIVYKLHEYIRTEHALIVQNDGYVVNSDRWTDDFLKYDYIGALWPLPTDTFSFRDANGDIQRMGNGGFSLRSKKLLKLASEVGLEWKPYFGFYHEDGFFCCHNRHVYEEHGCRFADNHIAARFSHETPTQETVGIIPFGFHGRNTVYYKQTIDKL